MSTILTSSGEYFDMLNPGASRFSIDDIAHALSNICRFTGHTRQFYSVAQHSVIVSQIVPPEYALDGLLHDATEAFIGDVSTPLKRLLGSYREIEEGIAIAIAKQFDLRLPLPLDVKIADQVALATEKRDLLPPRDDIEWPSLKDVRPLPQVIYPMPPFAAKRFFLDRFQELTQ